MTSENARRNPHIVVIGAGIVGASIAFHLSLRSARVTVLDAGQPGQAASAISFAWINARDKDPRHYHDLNRRSIDIWSRFQRRLGGDAGVTWGGELRWSATESGARNLAARVRELQSWGYPIRLLDAAELRETEPALEAGPVTAASYTEIDAHVDTARVIKACLDRAVQRGAEVRANTKVVRLYTARAGGKTVVEAVGTDAGGIPCDAVVLAAGADTAEVAALAGMEVPYRWTFGATIITGATSPVFRTVAAVHTPRDLPPPLLNFRQLPDGRVMVHGGSHDESLGRTDEEVQQVVDAARRFLPVLEFVKVSEVRRGRRPMPVDGLPILGFASSVPNLYFAAMHSGVTLAALVGEFAAIEVLDGARIDILEPYRVERFMR